MLQITLKQNQDSIIYILFYTVNEDQQENLFLNYDNTLDQNHYISLIIDTNQRFVHLSFDYLSKLKIEDRDDNDQVIDSYICELEKVL